MIILSGGQTGVDRAALDYAIDNNVFCGGWCPKGRMAEDGTIPAKYPLQEAAIKSYSWRTELNVRDSDATLVLYAGDIKNGTELTIKMAEKMNKPLFLINMEIVDLGLEEKFNNWLAEYGVEILNIAGPRESSNPGIYMRTRKFLEHLFH